VNYHQGRLDTGLLNSLLEMRILFEVETARLAALNRDVEHLEAFEQILEEQKMPFRLRRS